MVPVKGKVSYCFEFSLKCKKYKIFFRRNISHVNKGNKGLGGSEVSVVCLVCYNSMVL